MKKRSALWLIFLIFIATLTPLFAGSVDNTKIDWWLVRSRDHSTPRINDKLGFELETYDAYYIGDTASKVLYLTFDEGYEKGYTPQILDTLKAKDVKAMFFVTSPYVDKNPELVKRMVDEGHVVANHSNHHPSMPTYTGDPTKFANELNDVASKYEALIGKPMVKMFRPPMGHYSQKSLAMTKALGYKTVFWSFAYGDYDVDKQPSHETAKKMILNNLHNGSIMLLHAISKTNTEVLDEVIDEARNMGYTFELFQ
ncbi:MAG: delta-lactam-biosynthetic de-N-acetylase [Niameybacter sp.]|uniref:delta-lactam-biosynthetic de-N-acetylase n=1 Tax=Niameybacter sp. TaxID=2033640 RepID=UPI002FCC7CE7